MLECKDDVGNNKTYPEQHGAELSLKRLDTKAKHGMKSKYSPVIVSDGETFWGPYVPLRNDGNIYIYIHTHTRNPNVQRSFHNSLSLFPTLWQINPVHVLVSHFMKIHFYVIPPSTPSSSKSFPSLTFPRQTIISTSPLPCEPRAHSFHCSSFHHPNNI